MESTIDTVGCELPTASTTPFVDRTRPFVNMKISNNEFLKEIDGRQVCPKCNKSRKFFCYTCYVQLKDNPPFPYVKVSHYYLKQKKTFRNNKYFFFVAPRKD